MSHTIAVRYKGYNSITMRIKTEPKIKGKIVLSDDCYREIISHLDKDYSELLLINNKNEYKVVGIKGRFTLKLKGWRDPFTLNNQELFDGIVKETSSDICCVETLDGGSESAIVIFISVLFIIFLYPLYKFLARPFVDVILKNIFGKEVLSLGYENDIYVKIDTSDPNYFSKLKAFIYYLKENLWVPLSPLCIVEKNLPIKEFHLNRILNNKVSNGRNLIYASVTLGIAFPAYLLGFKILGFYFSFFNTLFSLFLSPIASLILFMWSMIMFSIGFYMVSSAYNLYKDINVNHLK